MALPLKTSTDETDELPLGCDPDLIAANPDRADGSSPLAEYADTGDPDRVTVPPTASVATVRALSKAEYREATRRAGRHSERDERVYMRVLEQTGEVARARLRAALEAAPEPGRSSALARLDGRIKGAPLAVLPVLDRAAVVEHMDATGEREGSAYGVAIDALSDDDFAAFTRYSDWRLRRNVELVRAGVLRLTAPPHAPWVAGPDGFPVEALLRQPVGEDAVAELAQMVTRVSTLGKAVRPSSGGGSGAATSGPTAGAVPVPTDATAGSTLPTVQNCLTADGC